VFQVFLWFVALFYKWTHYLKRAFREYDPLFSITAVIFHLKSFNHMFLCYVLVIGKEIFQ